MTEKEVNVVCDYINMGYKVLILLRGLPGSGKSTLAKTIVEKTFPLYDSRMFICSSDNFFSQSGAYRYNVEKIGMAHEWNHKNACDKIKEGLSPIIIDNTNLEWWEMKPYLICGAKYGYIIKILDVQTSWARNINILASRNSHKVPKDKIKKMLNKYEGKTSGDQLLGYFNITYSSDFKIPCMRNKPPSGVENVNMPKQYQKRRAITKNEKKKANFMPDYKKTPQSQKTLMDFSNMTISEPGCSSSNSSSMHNGEWSPSTNNWALETEQTKINKQPKPQRYELTAVQKDLINWEPIDITMSQWEQPHTSSDPHQGIHDNHTISFDASTTNNCSENDKYPSNCSRDVNQCYTSALSNITSSKLKTDESVMLSENDLSFITNKKEAIEEISSIFPTISKTSIGNLLVNCEDDGNWVAEIILKSNKHNSDLISPGNLDSEQNDNEFDIKEHVDDNHTQSKSTEIKTPDEFKPKSKKDKTASESSMLLKMEIEQNFKFADNSYSEHCLMVKKRMRGEKNEEPVSQPNGTMNSSEEMDAFNLDEIEYSPNNVATTIKEETIQFTLGKELIKQLDKYYGTCYDSDETLEPVVNMPVSIINQIHALWIESICSQKEQVHKTMVDDEEFVRQLELLEQQEVTEGTNKHVSNLQELLDMEMALAYYQDSVEPQEDLATKLTRQKLIDMFPELEKDVLMTIYSSYNNNFEQTLQSVLLSLGLITEHQTNGADAVTVRRLMEKQEQLLLDKAKREKEKVTKDESNAPSLNPFTKTDTVETINVEELTASIKYHRAEAQRHLNIRNIYHNKAKECINKKMGSGATIYSEIASLHAQKYDHETQLAISDLMQLSSQKGDYTLDLHSMNVLQAMQVLDVFLDSHIANLRSETAIRNINVLVITGQGRHSPQNIPRIKPAALKRLAERGLIITQMNPGLYSVNLSAMNLLSMDLKYCP